MSPVDLTTKASRPDSASRVLPEQGLTLDDWAGLRASLQVERDSELEQLEERLLELADPLRERLVPDRSLSAEWGPLGVEVREVSMLGRGSCSSDPDSRTIFVNCDDKPALQRFTVAHELAHLLLSGGAADAAGLRPRDEERLCDRFASAMLIPPSELDDALRSLGGPPGPDDLVRLCGRFRVNVRPIMFAMGARLENTDSFLLLARLRGHRRRPAELAFRVVATAGRRHAFMPREQRIASLGLVNLAAAAAEADHGALLRGRDSEAVIGLRGLPRDRSSDTIVGAVDWQAFKLGLEAPYVVAIIDLGSVLPRDILSPAEQ